MHEFARLAVGMGISDISNQPVGVVVAKYPQSFRVLRPDGTTATLRPESLFAVSEIVGWLVCNADQIRRYEPS